jgi:cell division control protein 6
METIQTELNSDNLAVVIPPRTVAEIDINFDQIGNIWRDKKCLDKGYTPKDVRILHREKEIKTYTRHLADALQNIVPGNLFVYGKMGTGKTMITNLITSKLEKKAAEKGINVKTVYIHCATARTNIDVMRVVNNQLMLYIDSKLSKTANSFNVYFTKFCQLMKKWNGILIIILDEIDKLEDPDIINLFARVKESRYLDENVCLIGITNDTRFEENLDARTLSVIARTNVIFSPYDANQLRDILRQRAEFAFSPGILDETVIPLCAAYAAQENGDARKAIELLKLSAVIAEEKNEERVTEAHVKLAQNRVDADMCSEMIQTLPTHSKIVLLSCIIDSLKGKGNHVSITGEIYIVYKELCKMICLEILTQRRVTDLLAELGVVGILNVKMKSKGRYGRTKEVTLMAPYQVYLDILMHDYRINGYKEAIEEKMRRLNLSC